MTYHLNPQEQLVDGLRDVAEDQIDSALDALDEAEDDLEAAVHDLRKRMKKLRGLIRLFRPGLGKTYKAENKAFRDIARLFSSIRDAQVLSETVGALVDHASDGPARQTLAPVADWARERRVEVLAEKGMENRLADARKRLTKARDRVGGWEIDGMPVEALRQGLAKTYKRARKRYAEAQRTPEPDLLHEWRKRVKYHWYHCRLLREAWPELICAQIHALDELSDLLGDDHDLVVLMRSLEREAPDIPAPAVAALRQLATDRSLYLRRRAFALAPQVMVETKSALSRRMAGYWTSAAAL
ncbi:CHAD domain-containing protein [Cribrihabitans sp. XS_ASV171]